MEIDMEPVSLPSKASKGLEQTKTYNNGNAKKKAGVIDLT